MSKEKNEIDILIEVKENIQKNIAFLNGVDDETSDEITHYLNRAIDSISSAIGYIGIAKAIIKNNAIKQLKDIRSLLIGKKESKGEEIN